MMVWTYLALLAAHWVGDFVLQTHWQASNKSHDNAALARHVATYTACLGVASVLLFGPTWMTAWFVVSNGAFHFGTDYGTSKETAKLYARKDWHNFFVVVGFDQLIHQATLALTMVSDFTW